jgi:hypothetical protein
VELILHVGLKKTATSTLQHVLHRTKAELLAQGLMFPCTPEAHQRLARRVRMRPVESLRAVREALAPILAEVRGAGADRVLLSSEHLVSSPATGLEDLRQMLETALPGVRIRVLAYVREPVGFATSMCQQSLKNGVMRLAEFQADPWPFPVAEWLATQIAVFGRENVTVRQFHPAHMAQGSIVADVLAAVGLDGVKVKGEVPHLNPSLSHEAVLVADALTELRPSIQRDRKRRNAYRRPLSKIKGGTFVLPTEVQERIIARSAADMAWLKAEFGLEILPQRMAEAVAPAMTVEMAEATAREILRKAES